MGAVEAMHSDGRLRAAPSTAMTPIRGAEENKKGTERRCWSIKDLAVTARGRTERPERSGKGAFLTLFPQKVV